MTHYTTLVQRCRSTNSLLADEIDAEFRRVEANARSWESMLKAHKGANELWARRYQELESLLVDACQLLDGKKAEGCAWSEWDQGVRDKLGEAIRPDALSTAEAKSLAEEEIQF